MKTSSPATADKNGEKLRFSEKLDLFLRKNRILLVVILGVLVAVLLVITGYSIVDGKRATAAAIKVEQLAEQITTWSNTEDKAKKAELAKPITEGLQAVVKAYPRQFAAARALTLLARMAESDKDWATGEKTWLTIYERFPKMYMAPIALQNAAVAAEERGAPDQAMAHYKLVVEKYAGKTVGIAHSYFSLGRLAEESKDYSQALTYYNKVVSDYPGDDWTKFAKDRIIAIKAQGSGK